MNPHDFAVSGRDLEEFKTLVLKECGPGQSDDEIKTMATNLLRLYTVLYTASPKQELPKLTENESIALHFIEAEIGAGKSPSVRELAQFMGLRSSRSGFNIVQPLIGK